MSKVLIRMRSPGLSDPPGITSGSTEFEESALSSAPAAHHVPPSSDGAQDRPGAGRDFVLRQGLIYTAGMIAANTFGAIVTFVYAAVVIPPIPGPGGPTAQMRLNLLVFAGYLVGALVIGVLWSLVRFRTTLSWLWDDRLPTEAERRTALTQPARQLLVHGVLWAMGVGLILVVNAGYSWVVAWDAALTTALGGLTTCALGYLLSERLLRPVTAMALADGEPDPPVGPGVMARVVWVWAFATGVPLVGAGLAIWIRSDTSALVSANTPVLFLLIAGLLAGSVSMLLLARSIAVPLASVRTALRAVEAGDTDVVVPVFDAGDIGQLQATVNHMVHGLRESKRVQDIFGRQVGPEVASQVLRQGIGLGGEVRYAAVLFVDLDGSTTFANSHAPTEVVELLNTFFGVVVDVIARHGGVVNKLYGDGALCVFGAPVDRPDAATAALAAGRELLERVTDLDDDEISAGIGISAGAVVAGNIGAQSRFEYTVIGDPVNEASRLTDLAKTRPGRLLASAVVLEAADASEARHWRSEESVILAGRAEPTCIVSPRPSRTHDRSSGTADVSAEARAR